MSFGKLEIVFDSPKAVYYTGSRVKGRVNIVLTSAKRLKAFSVRIRGKAAVHWSRKSKSGEKIFTDEEIYFEDERLPLGGNPLTVQTLNAGTYVFPFNWKIPEDIPSSFSHEHGFVRYTIRAAVQHITCHLKLKSCIGKTWREDVKTAEFPVLNILRQIGPKPSVLTKPLNMNEKVQVGKQAMDVRFSLKRCGITPGALVAVTLDIKNETDAKIQRVDLNVLKILVFRTEEATRERHSHIFNPMTYKVRPEDEKSGAKMLRLTEQFHLPPELWFLNLSDCKLIKVHFQCMADIWLVGVRKGVAMSLPLVLVNDNTFPLMKITPSLLKEAATIQEEPAEEKLPDDVTFLVKEEQDVKKKYGDSGDVIVKDTLRKKHREFSTDNGVTFTLFESRE